MLYQPISNYGLIGDCRTAALVSLEGSIDWFCPERFDAPAVFCRILDHTRGGYLRIQPVGRYSSFRRYIDDTNVLETTFSSERGEFRLLDFMPAPTQSPADDGETTSLLVRMIEVTRGNPSIEIRFKPTFDYARARGTFTLSHDGVLIAEGSDQFAALNCPAFKFEALDRETQVGFLVLEDGQKTSAVLACHSTREGALGALARADPEAELGRTLHYWREWASRCTYAGRYRSDVVRSALLLKLLTYEPSGAIVAAPTTSLPEEVGGVRNWDYRFSWLRDSSFILYSLCTIGYQDEAGHFLEWLRKTVRSRARRYPQIMYTIQGGTDIPEIVLDHLDGYRKSRPVRVGNAAALQQQFDIYGEVLISAYVHYAAIKEGAPGGASPGPDTWKFLSQLVEDAIKVWHRKDSGMWEVRGGHQHFLHSKLMCWAALDRGISLAENFDLQADLDRWKATRADIREAIEERGYNKEVGAFVQAFGSSTLDASALAIPRIGFLPATDPRVKNTIDKIRNELTQNGLVYRYLSEDGLTGGEGAFLMCSFWLVEAMTLAGDVDEARTLFEHLIRLSNDVGLFSEELDPETGAFLGNFPQGFTHLALIEAAANLAKVEKLGPEEEPQTEGERVLPAAKAVAEGHG